MLVFKDAQGHVVGSVPDLIWHKWITGQIASEFGEHELDLSVPSHWRYVVDTKEEPLLAVSGKVQVVGLIVTKHGMATRHSLLYAENEELFKSNISAQFPDLPEPMPVTWVESEQQLEEYANMQKGINITVGRFRLPRLRLEAMYYPPSERVARLTIGLMKAFDEGKIPDPRPFKFEEVEGTVLNTVFEPIWPEHPAVKKGDWINWVNP